MASKNNFSKLTNLKNALLVIPQLKLSDKALFIGNIFQFTNVFILKVCKSLTDNYF